MDGKLQQVFITMWLIIHSPQIDYLVHNGLVYINILRKTIVFYGMVISPSYHFDRVGSAYLRGLCFVKLLLQATMSGKYDLKLFMNIMSCHELLVIMVPFSILNRHASILSAHFHGEP